MTDDQYTAARNAYNEIHSIDYGLRDLLKDVKMPFGTAELIIMKLGFLNNRAEELDQFFPFTPKNS